MTNPRSKRPPWLAALTVGAIVRIIAAWSGYGVFASDDYVHVIEMAWHWLEDPGLPFNSRIRSELMARLVWLIFHGVTAMGLEERTVALRAIYTILGMYSLVAIPAGYRLAQSNFGDKAAHTAAWLLAVEAVLPRLSTRALISMASIPPLLWGLVVFDRAARAQPELRRHDFMVAGSLISLSALFRFQIGLIFMVLIVWLLSRPQQRIASLWLCLGGLCGVLAQLALDYHAFGSLTPAPYLYVRYNLAESSRYGVAPWFSYAGMYLLLTLPPATLAIAPGLWRAAKKATFLSSPLVVFAVAHSLIGHKEERFLFPTIPVFLVLMAPALVEAAQAGGWRRGLARTFWVLNTVLLVAATLSDAHRNVIAPMVEAGRDPAITRFYAVGPMLMPSYYLGETTEGHRVNTFDTLQSHLENHPPNGTTRILFKNPPSETELQKLRGHVHCEEPRWSHGDLVDQLLVWVNPIGNKRRRGPKMLIDCRDGPKALD